MRPTLADRLRAREPLRGILVRLPNEGLVELAGLVGLDFVVLDTEHGPGDQLAVAAHLALARSVGLEVLVRIAATAEIGRVLDLGAGGIVAPHVADAREAAVIVAATRYPPLGTRGFAGYTRSGDLGLVDPVQLHARNSREVAVVAMIEDLPAVAGAAAIAATAGIDAVLVGPADLAVSMGLVGRTDHPLVRDARARAHAAARSAGATVLTIAADVGELDGQFADGSDAVVLNAAAALGRLLRTVAGTGRSAHDGAAGPGQLPTVLLPGMGASSSVWDEVAGGLRELGPVVFGRIDLAESISGLVDTVLAAAPPRFGLVGHSLGGVVALHLALRAPERVAGLALVSCSAREGSAAQHARWDSDERAVLAGRLEEVLAAHAELATDRDGPARQRLLDCGRELGSDGLLRQLRAQHTRTDLRSRIAGALPRAVVISGARDAVSPPALQQELVSELPGSTWVVLDGVGHAAALEAPRELLAALRTVLTRPGSAG